MLKETTHFKAKSWERERDECVGLFILFEYIPIDSVGWWEMDQVSLDNASHGKSCRVKKW